MENGRGLGEVMAVARNLCVGRQARCAPEAPVARGGSGGMLPQKCLKFRSSEMPFLEAISSSYLTRVVICQRQHTTPYLKLPKMFKYVFCFLLFFNGDFLTWGGGGGGATAPLSPPAGYGHGGSVDEENSSSQVNVILGNMVEVLSFKHWVLLNQAN